jgi:esterase
MAWRFNLNVISEQYDNVRVPVPFFTSNTPALIVRGSKSRYINEADIEDYKKRFSSCEIVTIEDAGHWVHAEKPQEFFESVLKFISA